MATSFRQFGTLPVGIFLSKFGLKTAYDISQDPFWSILAYVNFWRLQGRSSILAKMGCLQKISFLDEGAMTHQNGMGF